MVVIFMSRKAPPGVSLVTAHVTGIYVQFQAEHYHVTCCDVRLLAKPNRKCGNRGPLDVNTEGSECLYCGLVHTILEGCRVGVVYGTILSCQQDLVSWHPVLVLCF